MGDAAGVAVQEQHRGARLGRRHEPAVQGLAVGGGDAHLLEGQPQLRRRGAVLAPHLGEIDEVRLEGIQQGGERGVAENETDEQGAEQPHADLYLSARISREIVSSCDTASIGQDRVRQAACMIFSKPASDCETV